jgi:hypothetical protein
VNAIYGLSGVLCSAQVVRLARFVLPVVLALLAALIVDTKPTKQITARAAAIDIPATQTSAGKQEKQLP